MNSTPRTPTPTRCGRSPVARVALCAALAIVGLVGLTGLTGCMEERVVSNTYGPFGEREDPKDKDGNPRWAGDVADASWAIALGRISGEQHRQIAETQKARLVNATGMTDVWTQDEGAVSMVYFGRYESPQDPRAQADMTRWQKLVASGKVKLPVLMLTPVSPGANASGDVAQFDLRNTANRGAYTLQIGYYDETLEKDPRFKGTTFRQVCEDAVAALRKEGHEAYYYHGPTRSMVTLGVFRENDIEVKLDRSGAPIYSPQVEKLRKEFPYNTANGLTMRETMQDGQKRDLPSFLVRIPGAKPQPIEAQRNRGTDRRSNDWLITN